MRQSLFGLGLGSGHGSGGVIVKVVKSARSNCSNLRRAKTVLAPRSAAVSRAAVPQSSRRLFTGKAGFSISSHARIRDNVHSPAAATSLVLLNSSAPVARGYPASQTSVSPAASPSAAAALGPRCQHPRGQQNDHRAEQKAVPVGEPHRLLHAVPDLVYTFLPKSCPPAPPAARQSPAFPAGSIAAKVQQHQRHQHHAAVNVGQTVGDIVPEKVAEEQPVGEL